MARGKVGRNFTPEKEEKEGGHKLYYSLVSVVSYARRRRLIKQAYKGEEVQGEEEVTACTIKITIFPYSNVCVVQYI